MTVRRVALLSLLVACGAKKPPPERPTLVDDTAASNGVVLKLSEFRDDMCSCHDAACESAAADNMTAWGNAEGHDPKDVKSFDLNDADQAKATEVVQQLAACAQAAIGTGAPPPPP